MPHRSMRVFAVVVGLAAAVPVIGAVPPADAATPAKRCTAEQGQDLIDAGRYKDAIREFTCVIATEPTGVEGYRGRIEAALLRGRYSDAVLDYARLTALVLPVHPDASSTLFEGYADRLAVDPEDIPALTGASFARWWFFQYNAAIHLLNDLLTVRPDDVYGNLFRGSSRLLQSVTRNEGLADIDRALALAPENPHLHYVIADAFTYGLVDPSRAFAHASQALDRGLDTPRVNAILASAYNAFGDLPAAATHIQRHLELVTTELLTTAPLAAGDSLALDLVPGRTYDTPVEAIAGETVAITTGSADYWDTIAVLLAPDGTPVVGSDDTIKYFAAFDWVAAVSGTYRLRVTFFESVITGVLDVTRD